MSNGVMYDNYVVFCVLAMFCLTCLLYYSTPKDLLVWIFTCCPWSTWTLGPSVKSVTSVANDKGDKEMILGAVHKPHGIYRTVEENPEKPQLRNRLMKGLCNQSSPQIGPFLQMMSVGSHSMSGREWIFIFLGVWSHGSWTVLLFVCFCESFPRLIVTSMVSWFFVLGFFMPTFIWAWFWIWNNLCRTVSRIRTIYEVCNKQQQSQSYHIKMTFKIISCVLFYWFCWLDILSRGLSSPFEELVLGSLRLLINKCLIHFI